MDPEDPYSDPDHFQKFHQNPPICFLVILYTNTSGSLDPHDPDSDPDYFQKLITCSLSHLRHFLKIS